jgi:hypothetical protein
MEITEHDPKEISKGIYRLGREFKSKPIDITNKINDIELVPVWKQTGDRPIECNNCEASAWLWDNGHVTKYMLDVFPESKNWWHIYLDGKLLGWLALNLDDNTYIFSYNGFAAFFVKKWGSKEEVLKYCLFVHSQGHEKR